PPEQLTAAVHRPSPETLEATLSTCAGSERSQCNAVTPSGNDGGWALRWSAATVQPPATSRATTAWPSAPAAPPTTHTSSRPGTWLLTAAHCAASGRSDATQRSAQRRGDGDHGHHQRPDGDGVEQRDHAP